MSTEYPRAAGANSMMTNSNTGDSVPGNSVTESEGVLFAAKPIWDRNRKRRPGLGRKAASSGAGHDTVIRDTDVHTRPADAAAAAPVRTRKAAQRNSTAPVALTAGVAGLVALGAAGWFMTRDPGVPEIAPSETMEVATAPVAPALLPPIEPAAAEVPAPPAVNDSMPARPAPTEVARVRPSAPAAAPSVNESGLDASASAVLPDGPQPYTTLNPDSIAAPPAGEQAAPPLLQMPPAPQAPPIQAEPVPAPVNPVNPANPAPTPDLTPPL